MRHSFLILLLLVVSGSCFAKVDSASPKISDTIDIVPAKDTITSSQAYVSADSTDIIVYQGWKPDPIRAVWMGAIIPGYGQIYNRSYWKLPIVYGAFMGCVYAITWNNGIYNDYKTAYRDIITDPFYDATDPSKSYVAILPKGYSIDNTGLGGSMGGKDKYASYLQSNMNSYRRYRDISIVATVLVYALTLVDAYVDAQLYDFDISTDLSLNIQPVRTTDILNNHSTDIKLAIKF